MRKVNGVKRKVMWDLWIPKPLSFKFWKLRARSRKKCLAENKMTIAVEEFTSGCFMLTSPSSYMFINSTLIHEREGPQGVQFYLLDVKAPMYQ